MSKNEIEIHEGNHFIARCANKIVHGSNINWYKNDKEINEYLDSRVKITWTENSSKLSLENLLLSDTGNYSCIANIKNIDKNPSKNFQLRVIPASQKQYDPCSLKPCLNNGLCLTKGIDRNIYCSCQENYSGEFCEKQTMWQNEDSYNVNDNKNVNGVFEKVSSPIIDKGTKKDLSYLITTSNSSRVYCETDENRFSPYCFPFRSDTMLNVLSITAVISLLLLAIVVCTLVIRKIQSRKRRLRSSTNLNRLNQTSYMSDPGLADFKSIKAPIYHIKEKESDLANCNEMQLSKFLLVDSNNLCEITNSPTNSVYYPIELKSPVKLDRKYHMNIGNISNHGISAQEPENFYNSFTTATITGPSIRYSSVETTKSTDNDEKTRDANFIYPKV